ncbi:MAG: YdcF family protein [Gammaproteobacteria bacterium]|nr:YdcF family protein [Gammaproteobacteria bacterium]
MIAALRAVIEAAILPPGLFLILLLGAAVCLRHRRRISMLLLCAVLSVLYLLSSPLVARWLAGILEQDQVPAVATALRGHADAIVVLGCDRYSDAPEFGRDDVSACSLVRLRYAAELAQQSGLPVLISGGNPRGETVPEAEIMGRVMQERLGVVARWLEGRSRNTDENAKFSAKLLMADQVKRVALVTHAIHMRRAARAFRRAGLEVTPAPTYYYSVRARAPAWAQVLPTTQSLLVSTLALREQFGLLWYILTGR